jgi:hypothetical protein
MFQNTLFISALFALTNAVIYGLVGYLLSKRVIKNPDSNLAWKLFTVWWFALSISTLITFAFNLLGAFGQAVLPLFVALNYINLLLICIALWGLLYYLFYLFTGNSRIFMPLSLFYVFNYFLLVYYITISAPSDVTIGRWSTSLAYRFPLTGPFFLVILVLLVFPQILSAFAYLTLFFRVREVTQKYRILLVSLSIIVWFGSSFIASLSGLSREDWWQILRLAIGLGAAVTILLAYLPPTFVKKRLGVFSITEEQS